MMRSMRMTIAMTMLLAMVGIASAQVDIWFGGWHSTDFFDPNNWTDLAMPASDTKANINTGLDAVIDDSPGTEEYHIHSIILGIYADNLNTLTVNGGSVVVDAQMEVGGLWTAGQGELTMNAGRIAPNAMYVGHYDSGLVTMNGGELNPWGLLKIGGAGGAGSMVINDGTVIASDLTMNDASQSIVIKDGSLDVTSEWADVSAKVLQYVADGWISAAPGYTIATTNYVNPRSTNPAVLITATADDIQGDIDGDGKVDMVDFLILSQNWLAGVE